MSALPESLTRTKPSTRAKKPATTDQYGRDPDSFSERTRASTDYQKDTGYAPFYHAFLADLPRLSSGQACTWLILTALAKSLGRGVKKGERRQESTLPLLISELAQICRCDVRTMERELAGLKQRKIAEVKPEGRGLVSIRLLYRDWQKLPDYKGNVVSIDGHEESEEKEKGEEKEKTPTRVQLTKAPQYVRSGAQSRSIPVTCGVKCVRVQNTSKVDLSFDAVVQAGELIVVSRVADKWLEKAEKQFLAAIKVNRLDSPERHWRQRTSGESESKAKQRISGESAADYCKIHPRAQEICNLFDPLLLKSQARLLSADSKALSEACQAVGACDHDFLVKFVMLRAAKPINSPLHIKLIVREAAANWEKVRNLPVGQQIPPKPVKRTSLVQRALDESRRRLEKYGEL